MSAAAVVSASAPVGPGAVCCWCAAALAWAHGAWWCPTPRCTAKQAEYAISISDKGAARYLYVPTPKQVEFHASPAKNRLFGGAAGGSKSHAIRWGMYRRALAIDGYEGLLLRRTMPELRKTHLRRMAREVPMLGGVYRKTEYIAEFPNGSLIECGHLDDESAVDKYLSTEYDEANADEGSTFDGEFLLELSTRARSSKPQVLAAGGAKFGVGTNPGGRGWVVLRDFFIDHCPDLERYPALREKYQPAQWVYIKALLDDNPWRDPDYESTLAVLNAARYEQLRWGAEYVTEGQFFSDWQESREGEPWHVREWALPRDLEYFGSMDWGYNAPGVFLLWAALPDGHYHVVEEYKFQLRSAEEVATEIKCRLKARGIRYMRYIACDPSMKSKTGHGRGESIYETLMRRGLPMRGSDNDRLNGWIRCHQLLRAAEDGRPWLTISADCVYGRRTIPGMVQDKHNPDDMDTSKDDHWVDAWRYGAMSRPSPTLFAQSSKRGGAGALLQQAMLGNQAPLLGSSGVRGAA